MKPKYIGFNFLFYLLQGLKLESDEWIWNHSGEPLDFESWGNGQPDNDWLHQHVSLLLFCFKCVYERDLILSIALLLTLTTIIAGGLLGNMGLT